MGWLHRTKHDDKESEVRSTLEIKKKNYTADNLQNKINERQEHLESISKKLESVKDEYGEALSNLMSVKKELIEKKKELENLKSKN